MSNFAEDVIVWLLAAPISAATSLTRFIRFCRTAYTPRIRCKSCGATISLVGLWKCHCGFAYRGHVLRECPICRGVAPMVRCFSCGLTQRLPQP